MIARFGGPAYRISTDRLALMCWDPAFAGQLDDLIGVSRESLLPWLRFAKRPTGDIIAQANVLRSFR